MNLDSIIENQDFRERVKINLENLIDTRRNRPPAPKGRKYKRDWYDRMRGNDMLSAEFFLKHIKDIKLKQSSLSSQVRKVIEHVCDKAYSEIPKTKK